MFIVGLTGGIGSGKSAAAAIFSDLGVTVVNADIVAREIVEPGSDALAQIANHFGQDIFCLLYTSPSPRDQRGSRMPSSA